MEMKTKNLMVSFVAIVTALFLVATVSAYTVDGDLASGITVKVDGMYVDSCNNDVISVIAGETISIKVYFTADENDADVTVEAELEGDKVDVEATTKSFDVEAGKKYKKVLSLKVPYELKDELSDDLILNIEIDGKDYKTEIEDIVLRVQRPSYNTAIKSISVAQTIESGETFPVDIVLKNIGYNDLDDIYVTASISALGIEKTSYFGDIVCLEECDCLDDVICEARSGSCIDEDDEDTASGRLYLKIPYDVKAGVYTLEITVENDDTTNSVAKQIFIENDFAENVIVTAYSRTVAVGEDAEYSLLIVNPTNKLKVYRIVSESTASLSSSTNQAVVAVPAGSSKTVTVIANADSEGEYNFDVNVFSGEELVSTATLRLNAQGKTTVTNPIVILTIILAIVFLVLLVVLIVLVTKKPEKSEEFGESYY